MREHAIGITFDGAGRGMPANAYAAPIVLDEENALGFPLWCASIKKSSRPPAGSDAQWMGTSSLIVASIREPGV